MARPLRMEFASVLYHVTSRKDGQDKILFEDENRDQRLKISESICERFNWIIQAYSQMGNRYHILIETPDGNLSKGMRQLDGVYTQRLNRNHYRARHVFLGRYKVFLGHKGVCLLELSRYMSLVEKARHKTLFSVYFLCNQKSTEQDLTP